MLVVMVLSVHLTGLLHEAIPSTIRAGVASGVSTLTWLVFLPFSVVFGVVADRVGVHGAGWLVVAIATATAAGPGAPRPTIAQVRACRGGGRGVNRHRTPAASTREDEPDVSSPFAADATLVAALRAGDEDAFCWLLDTYSARLHRLARSFVHTPERGRRGRAGDVAGRDRRHRSVRGPIQREDVDLPDPDEPGPPTWRPRRSHGALLRR